MIKNHHNAIHKLEIDVDIKSRAKEVLEERTALSLIAKLNHMDVG